MHDTLCFYVAREDFQTVLPTVCTLSVAWVTEICFDTYGNWSVVFFFFSFFKFLSYLKSALLGFWSISPAIDEDVCIFSKILVEVFYYCLQPNCTSVQQLHSGGRKKLFDLLWSLICSDVERWVFTVRCAYKRTLTSESLNTKWLLADI